MPENNLQIGLNPSPDGLQRLGAMIQRRQLTKGFFLTEEFQRTWEDVQARLNSDRGNDVWIALSVAGRASSISKPAEGVFLPAIKRRLSEPLPQWHVLEDGEDRYYLAKALQSAPNSRIVDLAFSELAREEAGEKARRVWAGMAFEHSSSREEFLVRLNECIAHVRQKQGLTTDALIRRLRRINNVIAEGLATAEKPAGSDFGNALRGFYAGRAIADGPDDRELREESAAEFVGCLARIARLNLGAASDPAVYGILTALRGWWRPSSPPERFEALSRKVAHAGIDVLHNHARQGARNTRLRQAIVDACGRSVVDLLSRAVVNADVSLPEDISYWFTHGTEQAGQRSTAAIEALSGKRLDEHIGRLLIAISSPDSNFRTIRAVADQVSILMPDEANTLSRAANRLSQITAWSKAAARSRDLELMGERGEIVAYDPAIHDANEDCVVGSKVVVVAPGAIRKMPDRPQVLIVKVEVRSP